MLRRYDVIVTEENGFKLKPPQIYYHTSLYRMRKDINHKSRGFAKKIKPGGVYQKNYFAFKCLLAPLYL